MKGQRFNCSNPSQVTNGAIADAVAAHWGCELVQDETPQWDLAGKTVYQSSAKAARVLGFDPQHKNVLDDIGAILDASYGDEPTLVVEF